MKALRIIIIMIWIYTDFLERKWQQFLWFPYSLVLFGYGSQGNKWEEWNDFGCGVVTSVSFVVVGWLFAPAMVDSFFIVRRTYIVNPPKNVGGTAGMIPFPCTGTRSTPEYTVSNFISIGTNQTIWNLGLSVIWLLYVTTKRVPVHTNTTTTTTTTNNNNNNNNNNNLCVRYNCSDRPPQSPTVIHISITTTTTKTVPEWSLIRLKINWVYPPIWHSNIETNSISLVVVVLAAVVISSFVQQWLIVWMWMGMTVHQPQQQLLIVIPQRVMDLRLYRKHDFQIL